MSKKPGCRFIVQPVKIYENNKTELPEEKQTENVDVVKPREYRITIRNPTSEAYSSSHRHTNFEVICFMVLISLVVAGFFVAVKLL